MLEQAKAAERAAAPGYAVQVTGTFSTFDPIATRRDPLEVQR